MNFKDASEVSDDVMKSHRLLHQYRLTGEPVRHRNDHQAMLLPEWAK